MPRLRTFVLALALLPFAGCSRIMLESGAGAETVSLPVLAHAESVEVTYLRKPEEGPLIYQKNAWWLFWGWIPMNHPNPARWRQDQLGDGAVAANERYVLRRPWYGWPVGLCTLGIATVTRIEYRFDPVEVEIAPKK